jgi:hypothetical protein
MEPWQAFNHFGGEFHAVRIDGEPLVIDFTLPCDYIQISAWGTCKKNGPVFGFDFFETAESTLLTKRFPCLFYLAVSFHFPAFSV